MWKLPKHYAETELCVVMRAAERFGQDPWRILREWSPGEINQAAAFDVFRNHEELRLMEASAGVGPR